MITFYRDKDNNYVYFPRSTRNTNTVTLNQTIQLHLGEATVIPEPRSLTQTVTMNGPTIYTNIDTREVLTKAEYNKRVGELHAKPLTLEVEVELLRMERDWLGEAHRVQSEEDIPFQIEDILYPADTRLKPLRHLGLDNINYFVVDNQKIAIAKGHELCQNAGLKLVEEYDRRSKKLGTYYLDDSFYHWQIEGKTFYEDIDFDRDDFTGTLEECMENIKKIESMVEEVFTNWALAYIEPDHVTVSQTMRRLQSIEDAVKRIETKVKTQTAYEKALIEIKELKQYVLEKSKKTLAELES